MEEEQDMQIEYVTDKGGAKLKLQVVDGQYYPTFPAHVIRNIKSVKIRKDDIILAGYLKSGTHWVWEILRMLLAGTTDVTNVEKDQSMIEQTEQEVLNSLPSPRVLNTHVLFEKLPEEVLCQRPKFVYLTRNPKDTVVSMYHHHCKLWEYYSYDGTFENYLSLFWDGKVDYGSWLNHVKNWSEAMKKYPELQILEVNYEDLSENAETQIRKLATFLGVSPTDEFVREIKAKCSLQTMRERKGQFDLDPQGNSIMYRKGEVGGWKACFTQDQNMWFDQVYDRQVASLETPFHWRFQLD